MTAGILAPGTPITSICASLIDVCASAPSLSREDVAPLHQVLLRVADGLSKEGARFGLRAGGDDSPAMSCLLVQQLLQLGTRHWSADMLSPWNQLYKAAAAVWPELVPMAV